MKFKSLFAVAVAACATSFAFAGQGDYMITFSTPGEDTYADGTPVADGEWYALCWAQDGQFDGLQTDLSPVQTNGTEEVVLAAPLAKGRRCPFTAFEFARNDKYNSGAFAIFLLDTRNAGGLPSAAGADGRPSFVKAASVATTTAKGSLDAVAAKAASAAGTVAWVQPSLQENLKATIDNPENGAKIVAFEVLGANVQLTVQNPSAATLVVKSGASLDKMTSYKVAPSAAPAADGRATFIISKDNSQFFSVGKLAQ